MARHIVPEAEDILDKTFPVLDKGFVRLIDYLGSDARIVQAARVSYGEGTKTIREDKSLIDYLLRNDHTSPFEMVSLTFHCKMPIFVARQWIRHRTAKVNEISGRYSIMKEEFYVPEAEQICLQSQRNKQGRGEPADEYLQKLFYEELQSVQQTSAKAYRRLFEAGIARELARIVLPLNLYTEWYWTMDLHNLLRFIKLRLHPHAQWEIRQYAQVIFDLTRKVAPLTCEAFEEHWQEGVKLSRSEVQALRPFLTKFLDNIENLDQKERERLKEKFQMD